MTELFVVWTPVSFVSAVVGGVLLGLLLAQMDARRYSVRRTMVAVLGLFALVMAVFWVGQVIDTYSAPAGPTLVWRVISRFAISLVYVAAMAIGCGIGLRHSRGSWR